MFFLKRYFFSSGKNIRNSTKVLLDLDEKYNKITQKKFASSQIPIKETETRHYLKSKKILQDNKQDLKKKIKNLENPKRKEKYYKETSDTIPFYDEKELQKRILNSKSGEKLFSLYNGHRFTFSIKNIVTTFTAYANLMKKSKKNRISSNDKRFISLSYTAEENVSQMNNLEKILLYWALTKLEIKENILESLTKTLGNSINSLNFKHLSIFAWCLAKNKIRNAELFGRISLRICEVIQPQNNIEVLGLHEDKTLALENESKDDDDDDMKSDLELDVDEEMDENEKSLIKREIMSLSSHSLTLALWAFGKSRMKDEELFELSSELILKNFDKFSSKMFNIILYAYKSVMIKSKIVIFVSEKINNNELDMSNESILTLKTCLISISSLKPINEIKPILIKLANIIIEKTSAKSQSLSAKFLSEILWNLSINKCYDKKLINKYENDIIKNIHKMNDIDLTQCFYSYCFFASLSKKREFNNILNLLVERMKTLRKKLNRKSLKLIEDGRKLCNYQNKDLNFLGNN